MFFVVVKFNVLSQKQIYMLHILYIKQTKTETAKNLQTRQINS